MAVPVSSSLGSMGPLLRLLETVMAPEQSWPEGITALEIQRLKDGLEKLCIFLKDVSESADPSLTAKYWMKEIRELCYDATDHLDEVMHSGHEEGACFSAFTIARRSLLVSVIFGIFSKLKRRPRIARDFSDLLASVEDACQTLESLKLPVSPDLAPSASAREKARLVEPLYTKEKQLKVVSIFGVQGNGKTELARKLYERTSEGKFECRAFLHMSSNPDLSSLLTNLLLKIGAPQSYGFSAVQDMVDSASAHLQGKRYLIIFDNLETTTVWDVIRRALPDGDSCSRIIITTRIEGVALACCSYQSEYIFKMGPLNDDESRQFLMDLVFHDEVVCPGFLNEIVDEFFRQYCLGINPTSLKEIFSGSVSDGVFRRLGRSPSTSDAMRQDPELTFNDLPAGLTSCLLYLSVFPKNCTIRKDDLAKQLVAEGFLADIKWRGFEEYVAGVYFDELVRRGILQPEDTDYDGNVLSCKVNHVILEHIRYKSTTDNFSTIVDNYQATLGLADKVRRLSVQFGGQESAKILECIRMSQIRSLIFFGLFRSLPSIVDYGFLRVLVLHIFPDKDNSSFDLSGIHQLFRLKYVKIECEKKEKNKWDVTVELPAKIHGLQDLETLEVHARLSSVPSDIGRLEKLLHLRLPFPRHNVLNLGSHSKLRDIHLTGSAVSPRLLVDNIDCLCSILERSEDLQSLILDGADTSTMSASDDGLSSLSRGQRFIHIVPTTYNVLQSLELSPRICIFPSIPKWFRILESLRILNIAVSELSEEGIGILNGLPALRALSLYVCITPVGRIFFDKGFPALKEFEFTCAALCLAFGKGAMPLVGRLKLRFNADILLQQYDPIHANFEHLSGLREVSIELGSAGADKSSTRAGECALREVFSNHPGTSIIHVQKVDSILHGDKLRHDDSRTLMRPAPSSYSPITGRTKRPSTFSVVNPALTVQGIKFMMKYMIFGSRLHNDDFRFIQGEMVRIEILIEENKENEMSDKWILQLQDLVYDIDDFICIYIWLSKKSPLGRIRQMIWIRNFSGTSIVSMIRTVAHRNCIEQMKSRINNLHNWQQTAKSRQNSCSTAVVFPHHSLSGISPHYIIEPDVVGLAKPLEELSDLLIDDHNNRLIDHNNRLLKVISIMGCSGSGKSTLAAAVFDRCKSEIDEVYWVTVSESDNADDLLNKIMVQFNSREANRTIAGVCRIDLHYIRNYLLVIDQLQRADVWYGVQNVFPKDDWGRIIVTTSVHSVALAAATFSPGSYLYTMRGLGLSDSKELFWRKAYGRGIEEPPPNLVEGPENVFTKCDGLPLALVSVANYVRRHHLVGRIERFGDYQAAFGEMNRALGQCYRSLPDYGHRTCMLSLSLFPQGHPIKRNTLIRRWAAEGLVAGDGTRNAEQVAADRFDELADRHIIYPVRTGNYSKVKIWRVRCPMHEFIINKAISSNMVTLLRKDELVPSIRPYRVRRLSVQGCTAESGRLVTESDLSVIRSLTFFKSEIFGFQSSKLLRVLDLEGCTGLDDAVLADVCELLFLKYLSLRDSDVSRIPRRIRRLQYLETLDLRNTSVRILPMEVMMLSQLVHLFGKFELPQDVRGFDEICTIEKFLSDTRLQTMSGFIMDSKNGFTPVVLQMRFLRKVKIWFTRQSDSQSEELIFSLQKRFTGDNPLESLSIELDGYPSYFLDSLQPPCVISSIKLSGKLGRLPNFISSLDTSVSDLRLSSTGLSSEELSVLQNLRYLLYLELNEEHSGFGDGMFEVLSGGFPRLQRLYVNAPKLPELNINEKAMINLTSLHLICLECTEKRVHGIEYLQRLNEVVLHHSVDANDTEAWKMRAMRHDNMPQIIRQTTEYLIIIDNLETTTVWDVIRRALPDGDSCSRIIITTRIEGVALACCSYQSEYIFRMGPLNDNKSRQFLMDLVFHDEVVCPRFLNVIVDEFFRQYCLGINPTSLKEIFSGSVSDGVFQGLGGSPSTSDAMRQDLELNPTSLKEIFSGSVSEIFPSRDYDGNVLSCKVNNVILEHIRYKSMKDNFSTIVENYQATLGLTDKVRRLSVQFGGQESAKILECIRMSQIRSLIFFGLFRSLPSIVDYGFLRVLVLHIFPDKDNSSFDLSGIHQLFRLKYVKIECEKKEKNKWDVTVELPAKIQGLQDLETLEVHAGSSSVPSDIGPLENLLHLRLPFPRHNVLNLRSHSKLRDIHLTGSAVSPRLLVHNIDCLCSILERSEDLQSLILDDTDTSIMSASDDGLSSLSRGQRFIHIVPTAYNVLQSLELSPRICIFPTIPKWFRILESLRILNIAVSELSEEDIDILHGLPALRALSLYVWITPVGRIFFDKGFPALKDFEFTCAALCLAFGEGAMPLVGRLKLRFNADILLQQYDPIHANFEHLSGLREVSIELGSAGADKSSTRAGECALREVFSNHPGTSIIHVQKADSILHGNKHRQDDSRILMPRVLSSYPPITGRTKRPSTFYVVNPALAVQGIKFMMKYMILGSRLHNDDFRFIQGEKVRIEILIEENKENEMSDKWILQLQDLVYDIDDFICIYMWLSKKSPLRSIRQMIWMRNFSGKSIISMLRTVAHTNCMEQLKARINNLHNWQQTAKSSQSSCSTEVVLPGHSLSGISSPYILEPDVVGFAKPLEELSEFLMDGNSRLEELSEFLMDDNSRLLKVISIMGCSGSGKSTLAAAVSDRWKSEFDGVYWVTVSESDNADNLLNKIMVQFDSREANMTTTVARWIEFQYRRKYLLVIDKLQRADVWYGVQNVFPKNSRMRIIVTTSVQSVALAAATSSPSSYLYSTRGLGVSDSKELFWRKAYGRDIKEPSPALVEGPENIFTKCDGLPLALVSIANYVRRHNLVGRIERFGDYQAAFGEMNRALGQCYKSLPDNGHRTCMVSLSIFPQGHPIKRNSLIRRWAAEGLVAGDGTRNAEQVAADRFDELADRHIIYPVRSGNYSKVKIWQVRCPIHEFIINKAISRNMITLIRKDELVPSIRPYPVRRLSVQGCTTESGRLVTESDLSVIRSLTFFKSEIFGFQSSKLLRVLDLEGCTGLDDAVLADVCELLFLKYISLRDSDVSRIPRRIRRLQYLETLDLRNTSVRILPMEVMMLSQLVHLFGKFELPQDLRGFDEICTIEKFLSDTRLQTMSGFIMDSKNGFTPVVLQMRFLRKVKIWFTRQSDSQSEELIFSLQKRFTGDNPLESLSIELDGYPSYFLDSLQPPCVISSIKLSGKLGSLPNFISSLDTSVSDLRLSSTGLSSEELSVLQNLRYVLYLELNEEHSGFGDGMFEVYSGGFPRLQRLYINAPKLPELNINEKAMINLTSLHLICLECTKKRVPGIEYLQRLNEVVLHHSVDANETEAWKMRAMRHDNRPQIIRQTTE